MCAGESAACANVTSAFRPRPRQRRSRGSRDVRQRWLL